jgi:hypothetical protein
VRGKTSVGTVHSPGMDTLRRRRLDERQQLVEWRRQYLACVGVDAELAATVAADLCWDLHALLQLLERGCPPHLAARICAPADEEHRP